MTKSLTPAERAKKPVSLPLSKAESTEAKKQGSVLGYVKLPVGRPLGSTKTAAASTEAAAS